LLFRFPKTHKNIGYLITALFIPFMAELAYTLFYKGMVGDIIKKPCAFQERPSCLAVKGAGTAVVDGGGGGGGGGG
jgi:hypothetical protein